MITFAHPLFLAAGAVLGLLLWFLWGYFETKRIVQLQRFVAAPLLKQLTANISSRRRLIKKILLLGAVFCCFVALARPQYGYRWIDVRHKGIDILFALDSSKSMLVEDIRPNRLERSKLAIMDFVSQLGGDRVGLMPFAGSSYLICPLTADYFAFEQSLAAVDTSIIPTGGTDIEQAIEAAENILRNEANHKILVLITDGENLQGNALTAARKAHEENMTIYAVGVGTAEGELIPDNSEGGFIKDSSGAYVKSRLDERGLTGISESAGGMYVPLGSQGQGLETIYRQKLALIPKTELAEKRKKVPIDRFEWLIAVALLLLSIEFLLTGRKTVHHLPRFRFGLKKKKSKKSVSLPAIIACCVLLGVITDTPLKASEGEKAYAAGNFLEAAEYYRQRLEKDPENPQLLYNSGTSAYKNNMLPDAAEKLTKALLSDDPGLQEKAYYNLGNVQYRRGEEVLTGDPQTAVKQWEQSLESYQGALSLNPENHNARYNHDLVKSRLDQLKQQLEQQQESSSQQGNDENPEEQNSEQENADKNRQSGQQEENDSEPGDSPSPQPGDDGNREQNPPSSPKPEENAQDEQKQTVSGDEAEQKEIQPSAGNQTPEQKNGPRHGETTAQSMTREEAEQLLQALQNQDGRLNLYIPMQENRENTTGKDW